MSTNVPSATGFVLPASVVGRTDVARLVRLVEQADNAVTSQAVRAKTGISSDTVTLPEQVAEFLQLNALSFDEGNARMEIIKQLRRLKDTAPVIHVTFAGEADRESLERLAYWFRTSVHRQVILSVGVQPSLVAGVYVRTPNHVHDLSLKAALKDGRSLLIKDLEVLSGRS